ncbi:glycosyltransferase family 2 protein [Actibacterium sp. MT2.3-13A]|uniref:glycosyltransferase family 2 protein n=1 Tax=Actibacterium sp. MT2.3-13A TaxID=2828332 RepID=UPI001BAB08C7|nr:glycosyltransferase family 2 protein [Actibacterium sp. MT2.3-13A]
MSLAPRVSVVVVSHDRPAALRLCLTGLRYLDHPEFEVIVAADRTGLEAVAAIGLAQVVKSVHVPARGISAARNAGLAQAAGEVVAFIDDDAVPEPSWLRHLAAPFSDPQVAAAGGYVRGRNGISFQWRGRTVDPTGRHSPVALTGEAPALLAGTPERAIKTEGTNMAFRRDLLAGMGGFDPGYTYFLDETDLNMRLARRGAVTALVPLAQVHHGFAASAWRNSARAPRTLYDIGASTARFLRKFAPEGTREAAAAGLRAEQRRRALQHMLRGTLEPRDVARLMASLERGLAEGATRPLPELPPLPGPASPFRPFPAHPAAPHAVLAGRPWQARALRRRAAEMAADGQRVTLFLFGPTALYHRMRFTPGGWWEQRGGLFGRSLRDGPLIAPQRFSSRLRAECHRLRAVRPVCNEREAPDAPQLHDTRDSL